RLTSSPPIQTARFPIGERCQARIAAVSITSRQSETQDGSWKGIRRDLPLPHHGDIRRARRAAPVQPHHDQRTPRHTRLRAARRDRVAPLGGSVCDAGGSGDRGRCGAGRGEPGGGSGSAEVGVRQFLVWLAGVLTGMGSAFAIAFICPHTGSPTWATVELVLAAYGLVVAALFWAKS